MKESPADALAGDFLGFIRLRFLVLKSFYISIREKAMHFSKKFGFTLVEIMIVIAIVGILVAVAIPNYLKSAQKSHKQTCIANLRLLECAVEEAKFGGEENVTLEMLIGPTKFIRSTPVCPTEKKPYIEINPPACPTLPGEHNLDNL